MIVINTFHAITSMDFIVTTLLLIIYSWNSNRICEHYKFQSHFEHKYKWVDQENLEITEQKHLFVNTAAIAFRRNCTKIEL